MLNIFLSLTLFVFASNTFDHSYEDWNNFLNTHKKCVIKPLYGNGGKDVFLSSINDPNLNVILEKFLELYPDCSIKFLEQIKGPVGLNIGSETAAEISISIISEILKIIRNMDGISLSKKVKRIHD